MRTIFIALSILLVVVAAFGANPAGRPASNEELVRLASDLSKLTRVTEKPVAMSPQVWALCVPNGTAGGHETLVPKRGAAIQVYVSPGGAAAMKDLRATFPLGTVILKQKLASSTATEAELFTGMLKREQGYNPSCGDWEFFTLGGDAKAVTSRGRIDSCMECHKSYPKSDFVTKQYR